MSANLAACRLADLLTFPARPAMEEVLRRAARLLYAVGQPRLREVAIGAGYQREHHRHGLYLYSFASRERTQRPVLSGVTVPTLNAVPIRAPYVDWILDGNKVWEIRSRPTKIRGLIGLIKSKSLTVVGTCRIVDVIGPLTRKDIRENAQAKMNEPPEECRDCEGAYAWVLEDARRLDTPVPYNHPSGAVTWVKLDEKTAARVARAPSTPAAGGTRT